MKETARTNCSVCTCRVRLKIQHGKTRLDVFCDVALGSQVVACCRGSDDLSDTLHVKRVISECRFMSIGDCCCHVCGEQCLELKSWLSLDIWQRIFTFVL